MSETVEITDFAPDCKNCHAICCVALAFDWPHYKKPAGVPCENLDRDFRCNKWDRLESEGFFGCRNFTCYGAGQAVARFIAEKSIPNWRQSGKDGHVELSIFQRVYSDLYSDFNKRPPPRKKET